MNSPNKKPMLLDWRMKHGGLCPLVSFVLPVYNVEPYIHQCLDSLCAQSLRHIEIICVDDGSTDKSLEILRRYEKKDRRVRVFTQKNQYAGVARNLGLSKAKGKYVCFLDSDDFFHEDLAKETYYAAELNRADIVVYDGMEFNHRTQKVGKAPYLLNYEKVPKKQPFSGKDCPNTLFQITSPCPWTKLFRRSFVLEKKLRFQALQNSNDVYFVMSALAAADRIYVLKKQLVYYRVGTKTNLQAKKQKHPFCFCEAFSALQNELYELGVMDTVRKSYVNAALNNCMYNLRTVEERIAKEKIFLKLKAGFLDTLEVTGYPESYYYENTNYKAMKMVLYGSFEEYMNM